MNNSITVKQKEKSAYFYALLAIFFWSTAATSFKITLRYLDVTALLFLSSVVSALILLGILISQNKLKTLLNLPLKSKFSSLLLGILNPFIYYIMLFQAYHMLPAQLAQPLNFIWPLMIVILAVPILGKKLKIIEIIAILVSFTGVIVISTKGSFTSFRGADPGGIVLALSTSIIWALFWLLNVKDSKDDIIKLFLNFSSGSLLILLFLIIRGNRLNLSLPGILGAVYIGMFEMSLTFNFWLKALKLSPSPARINNFIYLTPFLSLLVISLILKEKILISTILGLVLIISGIILQHRIKKIPV